MLNAGNESSPCWSNVDAMLGISEGLQEIGPVHIQEARVLQSVEYTKPMLSRTVPNPKLSQTILNT